MAAIGLTGCAAGTPEEQAKDRQVEELETPNSPLRHSLEKAAEHLPPGSSVEEQTAQAIKESGGK